MVALPVMVVGASRPRICERSLYKGFDNRFERAVTAAYDGDTVALEDVFRAVAHIAGQQGRDTHCVQTGRNVRFAAAADGCRHDLAA